MTADFSARVLPRVFTFETGKPVLSGFVFVLDSRFENPKWRLPSGRCKRKLDADALGLAGRVLREETGIHSGVSYKEIATWKEKCHKVHLFTAGFSFTILENRIAALHDGCKRAEFFPIDRYWRTLETGGFLDQHQAHLVQHRLLPEYVLPNKKAASGA